MELDAKQIETALEPLFSFHEQLKEEIEWYERVKRRDFQPIKNLSGLGQLLIALRISKGYSQSELARRLSVDVSQVSRDERNEYHGVSIDRVQRILNSLNVRLVSSVEFESVPEEEFVLPPFKRRPV